jgi:hypothetical protein
MAIALLDDTGIGTNLFENWKMHQSGLQLKDVVDKRGQHGHRLVRDTGIRMNLFENWEARARIS